MRTSWSSIRSIMLSGAVVLAASSAAAGQAKPPAPVDLSVVRKDLENARTAQEVYFTDHNSYSSVISALDLTLSEGVTIKFVESRPAAYSVSATLADKSGVSCVMFIGKVSAMPKTERGVAAKAEGEVLCDGDPPAPAEMTRGFSARRDRINRR